KKDDAELKKIGISREQLIDFAKMTKGDFAAKYGTGFMLSFPTEKVRNLPADLLARILPGEDPTVYLQKSGRVSTNADEKSRQVQDFKPGTPLGGVVRVVAQGAAAAGVIDPESVESIGQMGDLLEGMLPAATAGAARLKA